jgi:RTX calcium-binding nonapeptide repeat (4 copies)
MWGIRHRAMAATAVGVLATVAPMVSVGSMPSALGGPGQYTHVDGTTGDDLITGQAGADVLRPNRGSDLVRGAAGNDRIFLFNDGDVDRIHCGGGFDVVAYQFSVDQHDIIDSNCEGRIA